MPLTKEYLRKVNTTLKQANEELILLMEKRTETLVDRETTAILVKQMVMISGTLVLVQNLYERLGLEE